MRIGGDGPHDLRNSLRVNQEACERRDPIGDSVRVNAVEVDRLRVVRGATLALDALTLSIRAGCVTGLLGPSGSGKSTLMRAIVGVQRIESGFVTVLGQPAGAPAVRARVGYRTQ